MKTEPDAPTGPSAEELTQRHLEELQAQEARLNAAHNEALKAAVEAAKASVTPTKTETASGSSYTEEDIAAAVERGRKELAMKVKLKDQQITGLQAKLKNVEQSLMELRALDGIPPASAATAASGKAPAAPTAVTAPKPVTRKASLAAANAAASGTTAPTTTPAPTAGSSAKTTPAPASAATRGRGRGRGGATARQLGRGGSQAGAAAAAATAAADNSAGISISGAAAKRAREDGEGGSDDGLAKRLKPAEGGTKPVALRRPPANPPA
jgi:nucleoprotein TPR